MIGPCKYHAHSDGYSVLCCIRSISTSNMELVSPPARSYFLQLPLELRQHIYQYVLPSSAASCKHTRESRRRTRAISDNVVTGTRPNVLGREREKECGVVWLRGCISILAVNHQIHEECANILYGGNNLFAVNVRYDGILFKYRWLQLPSGLTPGRDVHFLDHFSHRNLRYPNPGLSLHFM